MLCRTVQHQTALSHQLLDMQEASFEKRLLLFPNRHVKLIILHTAFAREVIANQVNAVRSEDLSDLRMQPWSVALVPQLMNGLICDDTLILPKSIWLINLLEVPLYKFRALCKLT
jgi:hypothetical protein